jgi:hypothetical protein
VRGEIECEWEGWVWTSPVPLMPLMRLSWFRERLGIEEPIFSSSERMELSLRYRSKMADCPLVTWPFIWKPFIGLVWMVQERSLFILSNIC